jgi:20S proteasome alpha/beta subunit
MAATSRYRPPSPHMPLGFSQSQVEYAVKAVENGGTAVGIRCKDGIVLALEKLVTSKLLKAGANKRIATVDRNMGIVSNSHPLREHTTTCAALSDHIRQVSSGLLPDGRHFVSRARDEASSWRNLYKAPIPTASLADRMGSYVQAYTLYSSVRPFGVTAIIGGWDSEAELPVDGQVGSGPSVGSGGKKDGAKHGGPFLYMIEPSGLYWVGQTQNHLATIHTNRRRATMAQQRAKDDKSQSPSLRSYTFPKASSLSKRASRRLRASSTSHTTTTRTRSLSWR